MILHSSDFLFLTDSDSVPPTGFFHYLNTKSCKSVTFGGACFKVTGYLGRDTSHDVINHTLFQRKRNDKEKTAKSQKKLKSWRD